MTYNKIWIDPNLDPEKPVIILSSYIMSEFVTSRIAEIIFPNLESARELLDRTDNNPKITYSSVKQYIQ